MRHDRFLELAYQMALKAEGVHRHGTVIVSGGRILGKGSNNYTRGIHSEENALAKNWLSNFKGATVYNVRIRKEQKYGLSAPCKHCRELLLAAGVDRIIFTTNDKLNPIAFERI